MKSIFYFLFIIISIIASPVKSFSQCATPTTTTGSRCGEGSVTVSATSATGNYRWYDASSGGNILGNDASFNTPIISANTTFYVSEFNNGTTNDALEFDGTNDYVAIQDLHFITTELEVITMEAWVKTDVSGVSVWDNWSIVDFDRSEYFNFYVSGNNGTVGFSTTDNSGHTDDFYGTIAVNDNTWHHIAVVYDGTDKHIYIDGALDATKANPHGGKDLGKGSVRYGFVGDGSEATGFNGSRNYKYFDGSYDEIRVWSTARTAAEISSNYNKCVPEGQEDLMLYYRMDGVSGDNTLIDYSGNNYNGTLYNMDLAAVWITGTNLTDCPTCESARASVIAEIEAAPAIDLGVDKCVPTTSTILDAGAGFTSYSWSTGATTQQITVNSNGFYSVDVTHAANLCVGTDGISVSLLSEPDASDKDRCGEGTLALDIDNPSSTTYQWYDVATGGSAIGTGVNYTTPSISSTTSYYVSEIDNSQYKQALHFDGVNDMVAIDNLTYNGTNYTEVTVEAWIRTTDNSKQIIASYDRSEYWRLEIAGEGTNAGRVGFKIYTGDTDYSNGIVDFGGNAIVSDGNWHHVAAVFNNGSIKIYVDGNLDASTTTDSKFGKGTVRYGFLGVGSEASIYNGTTGPLDYFNGDIDEVRIWSVARNITQIQNNKDGCLLGTETGLQAYYKMEDGSGNTLSDHSINNSIGTLFNMDNSAWINTGKNIECSCGESDRREVTATVNAIPVVNLGLDRCEPAAVVLDAENAGGGYTYVWQDGSTNQTLNAATSQQYWARVTETATSCEGSDTVVISIGTTAKPTTTDGSRCGNGTVDLSVSNVNTIRWYDQQTGGTLLQTGLSYTTPSLNSNTDYYVSADEGTSCGESVREKITAEVNPEITALTTVKSWPGENGTVIVLSSTGGSGNYDYTELQGNFDYAGSYTAADVEKTVPNGGSYNIMVRDEKGCEYTTNGVVTNPIPTAIATSANTSVSLFIPQKNEWFYVTDNNSKAIVAIKSGSNALGKVDVELYIDGSTGIYDGYAFLKRHFVINVENQPTSNVEVKLLFSTNEYNSLKSEAANTAEPLDDISTIADIGVTKYEGPTENGNYKPGDATSLAFISQSSSGSEAEGKYIIIQTSSFSEFWPHASGGGSALPIELIRFETAKVNNDVVLSWTTATELNNEYFSLQRSVDGKEFNTIAKIDGAGNSNTILNYQYVDNKPLSGTSYYRLKQTDYDGKFAFSQIRAVKFAYDNEASLAIYPNPTNSKINMYFDGFVNDSKVEMSIYSVNGKLMLTKSIPLSENGDGNISMNIEQLLPAGVYFVRIIGENNIINNKIIVQ